MFNSFTFTFQQAKQNSDSLLQNSGLKEVGKTTRPLGYDLNQIPYN